MKIATFKVLNNSAQLSEEEIVQEILKAETLINSSSVLRFHLLGVKEEEDYIKQKFDRDGVQYT